VLFSWSAKRLETQTYRRGGAAFQLATRIIAARDNFYQQKNYGLKVEVGALAPVRRRRVD
jgi:hypothetical protein